MIEYYKLVGKSIVPCKDVLEWGEWFETANRRVALTSIAGMDVSTVFLGLNHNFSYSGQPPILFETMVFQKGRSEDEMRRYCTYEEAEAGHQEMVADIKSHPWSRIVLPWLRYAWYGIMLQRFRVMRNKFRALGRKIKSR